MLKRLFDIVVSLFVLILFSPIYLFLAYKVKKNLGSPVLFKQIRPGLHGKPFEMVKFRTMKDAVDAQGNPLPDAERLTPFGKMLRATSLDELPEFWNVLKGEMSLVGPRPIVADELERYQDDVDYYLMAKPGMTGLWQVSGRNDVDYDTRVYFDSWYVKNWSLWNDIAILFKTVNVVLKRDGAY